MVSMAQVIFLNQPKGLDPILRGQAGRSRLSIMLGSREPVNTHQPGSARPKKKRRLLADLHHGFDVSYGFTVG